MKKTAVFTIISKNYWAYALTLHQSLAQHQPDWDRYLLLVDRPGPGDFTDSELFTTVWVEDLALPDQQKFIFRYGIMELNTAVKPWMFERLKQEGYQRVIYLDPDILVLAPLLEVENLLQAGATAVLTPHLTAPLTDNRRPTELDIMRAGVYNLGFLAVGDTPQADALIQWWKNKLEFQAEVNFERGLFTDQKWMDLAPLFFAGMQILRDPGYNVAYWNLSHRPLTREHGVWLAAGRTLSFFHFSGINPENPGPFSKHQNRFDLESLAEGKTLVLEYVSRLLANGHHKWKGLPYSFGCFAEGTPIPDSIRVLYRESAALEKIAGSNPFTRVSCFTEVPEVGLPPIVQAILLRRPDVLGCFPDPGGSDYRAVLNWFLNDRGARLGVAETFITPIRKRLAACGDSVPHESSAWLDWGGMLEYLHCRWHGAPPSVQRLQQYGNIRSLRQFLTLGYQQACRHFQSKGWRLFPRPGGEIPSPQGNPAAPECLTSGDEDREATPPPRVNFSGINVVGYVRSEHGLGQSPRLFSTALQAASIPHLLIDFNVGNSSRIEETSHAHLIAEHPAHPVNVFHINADQMPVVHRHLPPDFFQNRYNIGFWHWELPELPEIFLSGFNGLDEVWVPTAFVQDAIAKKSPVPVVKIPHAIDFAVDPHIGRSYFGLPEKIFLFLVMYDFSSFQERKNPKAVLDAFDRAFGRVATGAALVIKTQNSHHHPQPAAELQAWLAGRTNVIWIDRTITRQEVYSLESLCDCFVSLHRSEGFGLGPAEAMFLGKPVIATNWSGNTEFMRQDNSLPVNYELITIAETLGGVYQKGQKWAAPDLDHAVWLMRQVVEDQELRTRISRAARQTILADLAPARIGNLVKDRLNFLESRRG